MTTAPLRMRSGLLTKSLRSRTRSGDANLDAELLKSRELKSGSEPVGLWKQLKREDTPSKAVDDEATAPASAECMQEIKQILAQRETTRCLTFGCSPPSRSDNPLATTFRRCTPKPQPEVCIGFRTDTSCVSPPAHA